MSPNDGYDIDAWLDNANRDLVACTAGQVDVEGALAQVSQRAAAESADEPNPYSHLVKGRRLAQPNLEPAGPPNLQVATTHTAPGPLGSVDVGQIDDEDPASDDADRRLTSSSDNPASSGYRWRPRTEASFLVALVKELKTLRKGRGLFVRQIGERVGPALREAGNVLDSDGPSEIRRKVSVHLSALASALPHDLRIAISAAFALHPEARLPFYQERVRWAAQQLGRDDRTARRRIDEAIERLAELALTSSMQAESAHATDWHIDKLRISLALDQPVPEAFEFRRVVADRDSISELDLAATLTAASAHDLATVYERSLDVFFGGRLIHKRLTSTDRVRPVLELPTPLDRESRHDFALRYQVPGSQVQPHYVWVPNHRCDVFELHVRFDPERLPASVWRLTDAFQRDVDDPTPTSEILTPDAAGEVRITFRRLTPGLAYGLRWIPPLNR
jgi:hypothetical protein